MTTNVTLPRLSCPFPARISPFAECAHQHTLQWVRHYRLVKDNKAFERLQLSKFGWLAARAYPNAPIERLEIVSDWNTWLFILDDQCDEWGLGRQPAHLAALHEKCLKTLTGKSPSADDGPLIHAIDDIRRRVEPLMSLAWLSRFIQSASEYFESTVWEADNRAGRRWPTVSDYVRMRPYTGGLYTDIELIELTEGIHLPLLVRKNPLINELVVITNNVVCWSNDIISLQKERAHHDVHNLALILQRQSKLSLQEAVNRVTRLIDAQIKRFTALEKRLPDLGDDVHDVKGFVSVLRSWMRGNLDWSYESGRYRPGMVEDVAHGLPASFGLCTLAK